MSWLDDIKKKLSSPEDDKTPLHKKMSAERTSQLVGKGPVNPFRTMREQSKSELDLGASSDKGVPEKPFMTKSMFKQTVQLAEQGSPEAKNLLGRMKIGDVSSNEADAVYDTYLRVRGK